MHTEEERQEEEGATGGLLLSLWLAHWRLLAADCMQLAAGDCIGEREMEERMEGGHVNAANVL